MQRIFLHLSYVGTNYSGWQLQENTHNANINTIQLQLEAALFKLTKLKIRANAAGRTDAGVHADAMPVHFDVPKHLTDIKWRYALNNILPKDIQVVDYQLVPKDFHTRIHAQSKIYSYLLWIGTNYVPPKYYPFVWAVNKLDYELIDKAIPLLLGKHNFASFQNVGTKLKSSIRTMYEIKRIEHNEKNIVELTFEADGFLKQMVRNLVGLLVAIGQNKFDYNDIPSLLKQAKRLDSIITADAKGLTLKAVKYDLPYIEI